MNIVNNPKEADIIIVNTCGFIEAAKEEAINTLLEMAEYKQNGKCKYVIAMGCLVKRYKEDLIKSMPEVDLFISTDEYEIIWEKINELIKYEEKQKNIIIVDNIDDLRDVLEDYDSFICQMNQEIVSHNESFNVEFEKIMKNLL